jgi:hypothetical protein
LRSAAFARKKRSANRQVYGESSHLSPQIQTPTRLKDIAEQRRSLNSATCKLFLGDCRHRTTVANRSLMILIRSQRLTTSHNVSRPGGPDRNALVPPFDRRPRAASQRPWVIETHNYPQRLSRPNARFSMIYA